jgi:hypothetical protein
MQMMMVTEFLKLEIWNVKPSHNQRYINNPAWCCGNEKTVPTSTNADAQERPFKVQKFTRHARR